MPVKHWLALSAEYAFHSVPYLSPAYLLLSIKKKKKARYFFQLQSIQITNQEMVSKQGSGPIPSYLTPSQHRSVCLGPQPSARWEGENRGIHNPGTYGDTQREIPGETAM